MTDVQHVPHATFLPPGVETSCCPWCGQPITHEEFREIEERIKAEERQRLVQLEEALKDKFHREEQTRAAQAEVEKQAIRQANAAALEEERKRSLEREAAAREESRKAAVAESAEQLASARMEKAEAEEALQAAQREKMTALNQERENASRDYQLLEGRLEQLKKEKDETVAAADEEKKRASERELLARDEARRNTLAEVSEQLASAHEKRVAAESTIAQLEKDKEEAIEAAIEEKKKADAREVEVRAEERQATLSELNAQVARAESEKLAAEQAKLAAESKLQAEQEQLRLHHQEEIAKQREALEKDKESALNQERAKAFHDQQKLEGKIEELKRQVQSKTSSELGEGAEVDLFQALRGEFEEDRISRIAKGEAGADVRHEVVHQGEVCGCIVYDSKNRKVWRHEYAQKLRADQLAAEADHALLTTQFFPTGESQVCLRDGVIIANPARAVVLVHLLRDHLIQAHRLRLSGEDRESKTAQLYDFMISDRCGQLLKRADDLTENLLQLDVKEQEVHTRTWQQRGALLRATEKAHREFRTEVARIIET